MSKAKENGSGHKYAADSIQVLEGLEPVRKRPGMYIGSTGPEGLHHCVIEIFDNSRDEAMGGYADEVEVTILPGDIVRVVDNGRGIPVGIHKKTKVSALETVMTTLHAGGKFDGESYKIAGGLHGVGASVVNALSEWTIAEVHQDGDLYRQEYARGVKKANVKKVGKTKSRGTVITFKPDAQIFSELVFDADKLKNHFRQQAYLVKKLRIRLIDARTLPEVPDLKETFWFAALGLDALSHTFYFEGGLLSLVNFYNLHEKAVQKNVFCVEKESGDIQVEIALQYIDDIKVREFSYANNTSTPEGGTHLTGFRTALTRTLNEYGRKNGLIKDNEDNFTGDDVREGITAVVSVKMRDAQFEGQTKAKLGSVEAQGAVAGVFGEAFALYLEENPDDAKAIISKVVLALKARKAAKAAKDSVLRKGALDGMTLPGKLADCQSRSANESELFLVEGESAGGSSKMGRDRRTQAILPLRGKILNVERARLDKMLSSQEIKNLVIALGTAIAETFDISRLRYHKVIIATDADVDGAHIRTLLLTLFFRYFRALLDAGHIYVATPPLYKIWKGKDVRYAYTDVEKERVLKDFGVDNLAIETEADTEEGGTEGGQQNSGVEDESEGEDGKKTKKNPKVSIQRYKGLGEMNADELWETTMNPATRTLRKITIEDAEEADKTFDMLMGSEVAPRKLFIQTHARAATIDA
ncbi:MAG: DNA topoisomerase IV subunit B [Candidatus Vogelbacteria bacterium CG10_big_fil_rev_8_21_14_0_10_51_16]|uniref:DNA topoisomerase (ATP-hydrolyzing) n=1 Tax=Candidatus Vogelbacteria bacterium CG10_big_fil_rev_8_21_14_0_10_51_16 TaxID=1975045 RepID=A0A2H0RFD0_9BACT|nr:MAG: DNA topoisomerase IV subunit B [Candidatus Vogelbacteria bacterium CG10_big_fil_rev_8_21_14_0_10_51_16]